jgi:hypothetical protein
MVFLPTPPAVDSQLGDVRKNVPKYTCQSSGAACESPRSSTLKPVTRASGRRLCPPADSPQELRILCVVSRMMKKARSKSDCYLDLMKIAGEGK